MEVKPRVQIYRAFYKACNHCFVKAVRYSILQGAETCMDLSPAGSLPAGSHHMSPLLAPASPLPGPPWLPAHTPQAAEKVRRRQERQKTLHIFRKKKTALNLRHGIANFGNSF